MFVLGYCISFHHLNVLLRTLHPMLHFICMYVDVMGPDFQKILGKT